MYSIEQIKAMNKRATIKAGQEDLLPYIAKYDGDIGVKNCERLGNYTPKGWKAINTYFVDNSGFGNVSEPAMTLEQFLKIVKQGILWIF